MIHAYVYTYSLSYVFMIFGCTYISYCALGDKNSFWSFFNHEMAAPR